ncbi:MAG: hypothetical protein ACI85I_001548 [Arenicella sp.]|jgi:hypothetical protein
MSHKIIQTDDGCISNPEKWLPRLHVYENRNLLKLEGNFVAEDAGVILNQLTKYIRDFIQSSFVFEVKKQNTASQMVIWHILFTLEQDFIKEKIKVEWHYNRDDEDLAEQGEEFQDLFEKLHLVLMPQ